MLEIISKYNPLSRSSKSRELEAKAAELARKEALTAGLEVEITKRSNALQRHAVELERTAEEVLYNLDRFRGNCDADKSC